MKRHWQALFALALAAFLLLVAIPLVYSQPPVLSNKTKTDQTYCKEPYKYQSKAVCLDSHFLFFIHNSKLVGGYDQNKRVEIITQRIKEIADNSSIKTESLRVDNWKGEITNIVSPNGVIVTLTKDDVAAAKVIGDNREKLAEIYLLKIKNRIDLYRKQKEKEQHITEHVGWTENIKSFFSFPYASLVLIVIIICLVLLIGLIRGLFDLLKNKSPKWARRFVEKDWKFIVEVFGGLLQLLLIIMILALVMRAVLIFFNANFVDAIFPRENLTKSDITELLNHIFSLLQLIGIILVLGVLALVLHSLSSQKECIIIRPFENDTKGQYPENIGKAIADSLIEELERIRQIHTLLKDVDTQDIKLAPRLERYVNFAPPRIQDNPLEQLQGIGTVEVSGTRFTLDPILLYLRHVWPFGGVNTIITGSLQTYNSDNRLVAKLSSSNKVSALEVTEVTHPNQPNVSIPEMIRELAFKIAWSLQTPNSISAKTWEGFKWLTEATAKYYQYKQNEQLEYLDSAYNHCQAAMKAENHYESVADLFYLVGIAYLEQKKYDKAEQALLSSIQINSRSSTTAYFHHGLGNVYYAQRKFDDALEQYCHAIRLNEEFANCCERLFRIYPKNVNPYNGLGNVYSELEKPQALIEKKYQKASKQDFTLWKPYNNLGLSYLYGLNSSQESYDKAAEEFKKAIGCDSRQRISTCMIKLKIAHLISCLNWVKITRIILKIDYYLDRCLGNWIDKNSHPHSGLGLAYFYKYYNYHKSHQYQNITSKLLKNAKKEIQKAIEIDGNVAIFYWNLGLIKLGNLLKEKKMENAKKEKIITEVILCWKKALKIVEKNQNNDRINENTKSLKLVNFYENEETHYTLIRALNIVENDEADDEALPRAIYKYVINVFEAGQSNARSKTMLRMIEALLQPQNFPLRKAYLNSLKTDLDTIYEILKNQNLTDKYKDLPSALKQLCDLPF
jgi:tetratricopeptide (TPR) repeat protein